MGRRSWKPAAALARADAAESYVKVPTAVGSLLAAEGCSYMLGAWNALSAILDHHDKEQYDNGGMPPCQLLVRMMEAVGRSRSSVYRYLRKFEDLGLLDRSGVRGHPRRGPRTIVRFFLRHALWRRYRPKGAPAPGHAPQAPPAAAEAGAEPSRGPPPDITPDMRRQNAAIGREAIERLTQQ